MLRYLVYGLNLYSSQEIPGLVPLSNIGTSTSRVYVGLGFMPQWMNDALVGMQEEQEWYVSDYQDENGEPGLRIWKLNNGDHFWFRYSDGTEFVVDYRGTQLWATWPDSLTLENTATYLLGPVLGFVLSLWRVTCLHASAVAVGNQAIAFVGEMGAGKSTTAAAFAKLGYPVLADDVVVLLDQGDTFLVQPAYPRIRLWSESVKTLYGSPKALPRIVPTHPTWDKRYLNLTQHGYQFQQQPLPLSGIYLLGDRSFDTAAPFVEAVPTQIGLISLVANSYASYLLSKKMRGQEFEVLTRLIQQVPLQRVTPHTDSAYLFKLCETILADSQTLGSPQPLITHA